MLAWEANQLAAIVPALPEAKRTALHQRARFDQRAGLIKRQAVDEGFAPRNFTGLFRSAHITACPLSLSREQTAQ